MKKKSAIRAAPARIMRWRGAMISRLGADFCSTGGENYWRDRGKSSPLFAKRDSNFKILFAPIMVAVAQWESPRLWFLLLRVRVPSATRLRKSQIPNPKVQGGDSTVWVLELGVCDLQNVPVAQPDRASDFGSEGWGFESLQARHFSGFVAFMRDSVAK